jgi:ABC-2 type transport system permease protein
MGGRIRALIVKELLAVLRDPRARMVLILPPIIQLVVFSYAGTLEVNNVSVAFLNEDSGKWGYELVQRFAGSPTFTRIRYLGSVADIRTVIDDQTAILVVHIPQDFSSDIAAGRNAPLQLVLDGRRSNAAQIVLGYVNRIVDQMDRDIAAATGEAAPASLIVARNWFNPNLEYQWFTVPSLLAIITTLAGLTITALSVARERELGTFEQLLVSPLKPFEIIVGKSVPSLIIGLFHGTLFLLAAVFFFRIPFTGSLVLLYASLVAYLVSTIGIGLFISSIAKTQQQAFLGAFLFMSPSILLSGFATPIENMPQWLQYLTLLNPIRHFLVIVNGLFTKAMPAPVVFADAWWLVAIGLVTVSSAAWLFRRRME